ncbi:malate synthase A [Kineosporia babensis]|uniref:Malate synthase n=1 Tax=Kineosporia babensis TaxID=499548 RepID=A0A9X1NDU6_9ACTN|nr:malate synthase A [Kineosporia babensis]MCD5311238.1 malate synthase A [Kineosporia babensis]
MQILGTTGGRYAEILTPPALALIQTLHEAFEERRQELLAERVARRRRLASGEEKLDFRPETAWIRNGDWRVAGAAEGLRDRRVEITGPPTPKMTVNALNSGAQVWLADFEDALAPTWPNLVEGQLALLDAARGRLDFTENGKRYRVGANPATVVARPRGWHLDEQHILVHGRPVAGALVDFALFLTHAGRERPYFYLPKLEGHPEARLWNDVFNLAQKQLGMPEGTIRATVLIETITAAFEMEEILYELREHCAGLNAGRWDYLFSIVRTFGEKQVLPQRDQLSMTVPFLRAYTELLVSTCHRRGAYAIGGMAAFIPSRDAEANAVAEAKVRQDKEREAEDGFDGSWVAHPGLVGLCREVFDDVLGPRPDQLHRRRPEVWVSAEELLDFSSAGTLVTEDGLRENIAVTVRYLDAWLSGNGAVAIFGLMEDAATAEISRCLVWQWVRHEVFPRALVERLVWEETAGLTHGGKVFDLFVQTALGPDLPAFFTPRAYAQHLVQLEDLSSAA